MIAILRTIVWILQIVSLFYATSMAGYVILALAITILWFSLVFEQADNEPYYEDEVDSDEGF